MPNLHEGSSIYLIVHSSALVLVHYEGYSVSTSCLHIQSTKVYCEANLIMVPTNSVDDQSSQTGADLHLSTQ